MLKTQKILVPVDCHLKDYIFGMMEQQIRDADYKSYLSPGKIGDSTLKECWQRLATLRKDMIMDMRKDITPVIDVEASEFA